MEKTLLDQVANILAIVFCFFCFCSRDYLTGTKVLFLKIEQSTGHVQVKNMAFSMCGIYIFLRPMSTFTSNYAYCS